MAVHRALDDEVMALLASGRIALNPQFLFVSSSISNDAAAAAVGAAGLAVTADAIRAPRIDRKRYRVISWITALGLLTKLSTLPGLSMAALAVFVLDRRPIGSRLRDAGLASFLLAICIGPYLFWNLLHRGDLLGLSAGWQSATSEHR